MTTEEMRTYLKSYRNKANRVEYINNKLLGVSAISFDGVKGRNGEAKTTNDYILMRDKYLEEMKVIRDEIESLDNDTYKDILFYKYIEDMNIYDIADLMNYSYITIGIYLAKAVEYMALEIDK